MSLLSKRFRHIMIDLETFGTGSNAAIVSIGAVAFNPETREVNEKDSFHQRIDLAKSASPGNIDASTVEWWLRQDEDARKALVIEPRFELDQTLAHFYAWAERFANGNNPKIDDTLNVWSNPPTFDERLLIEACARNRMVYPFHYRTTRCLRTLKALGLSFGIESEISFGGIKHNALSDAIHQALQVIDIYQRMRALLPELPHD